MCALPRNERFSGVTDIPGRLDAWTSSERHTIGATCELEKIENCREFHCHRVKYNGGGINIKIKGAWILRKLRPQAGREKQ